MGDWIAIVGSSEDGREAVTRRLVERLHEAGVDVGGFVQTARRDGEGELLGFDLECVATGRREPLARRLRGPDPDLCEWSFLEAGLEAAGAWARRGAVCFVEAGRLEAAERGHWPTILRALAERPLTALSLRPSALAPLALRLPDPVDSIELPAEPAEVDRFCARVCERAAGRTP